MKMKDSITYAIDFGTSNSLLAYSQNGKAKSPLIMDSKNTDPTIFRSLMYFSRGGGAKFGQSAIDTYIEESGEGRFIRSIKKYLPSKSFQGTQINSRIYKIEELIGCFLKEVKSRADIYFDRDIKNVVLGRPARFSIDDSSDQLAQDRLETAAKEAGFKNIEFFSEPLAAAYSYRSELDSEKLVLVVDLGGGTSDFTVIKIGSKDRGKEDVLSLGGVSVAGDMLDGCIMANRVAPYFGSQVKYQFPMSNNTLSMPAALKINLSSPADITLMSRSSIMPFLNDVRKCKMTRDDKDRLDLLFNLIDENLGFSLFEKIELSKKLICEKGSGEFLFNDLDLHIKENITNKEFEEYTSSKIDTIFSTLDEVIKMAQVNYEDIDLICCTGGTSKVPSIKKGLLSRFGSEKIQSFKNFHSVIQGLAERAAELG